MKQFLPTRRSSDGGDARAPFRPFEKFSSIGFWKRQARTWHWMSGAICLIGMLLFAITGITLNHAGEIEATPRITEHEMTLSPQARALIAPEIDIADRAPLPREVRAEIRRETGARIGEAAGEWTGGDVYVSLPRPGGDGWVSIDRETGDVFHEATARGAIAYLNDLHKGRHTGAVWSLFLDVFALACIVFCLTGLWLLQIHSQRRGSTWPLAGLGLGIPLLLLLFFVHA